MPIRPLRIAAVVLLAALGAIGALAQEARPGAFAQLFPAPTGRNGYEELVLAGDLASAAESRKLLTGEGVTLTELREGVREPDRARALALVKAGLRKPISSPRTRLGPNTALPELPGMRSLARLLGARIRVEVAEGRTAEAIQDFDLGLRLAATLHGETLIGSLVATAIDAILVRAVAKHLEQLSANDCERLIQVVRNIRRLPDPTLTALEAERRFILSQFAALRKEPSGAPDLSNLFMGAGEQGAARPGLDAEARRRLQDPGAREAFLTDLIGRLNGYLDRLAAETARQPWQRRPVPPDPADTSVAAAIYATVQQPLEKAAERFASARLQVQLLAVHAAIRRYAWEYDRLPGSLEELKLGDLALDPFTGKPLTYRASGPTGYEVYSAGASGPEGRKRIDLLGVRSP